MSGWLRLDRGRLIVVGDLHGMAGALERLMAHVQPGADDTIVFLGDLCDRTLGSAAVPAALRALRRRCPRLLLVRGNHDQALLDAIAGEHSDQHGLGALVAWMDMGGAWAAEADPADLVWLARWIREAPCSGAVRLPDGQTVGLVHGEVPPGWSWDRFRGALGRGCPEAREAALWGRSRLHGLRQGNRRPMACHVPGVDLVLCGHSVVPEVFRAGNVWWLDTGSGWMAQELPRPRLTALVFPGPEIVSVPAAAPADTPRHLRPRILRETLEALHAAWPVIERARRRWAGQTAPSPMTTRP